MMVKERTNQERNRRQKTEKKSAQGKKGGNDQPVGHKAENQKKIIGKGRKHQRETG